MPSILIVEDEPTIAQSLQYTLEAEGFRCHWCELALDGVAYALDHEVDLVILDVGLPDITGFEACKKIRTQSEVPIIFLTARADEIDRVVGLEIGADDYVVKPFSPREVCARVKAILKRTTPIQAHTLEPSDNTSTHAQFTVDASNIEIRFSGQPLPLTKAEFQIFQHLLSHPRQVLSRSQLLKTMGSPNHVSYERSVDTHIKTLRAKLKKAGAKASAVTTVRGFGYRYEPHN